MKCDIAIIGGGAAGFFTAINAATQNPKLKIVILERGKEVLSKVRISGGGRCNVTHDCMDPRELVKNYPRGEKELLGPFSKFGPKQTIEWFESRGVALKTESDGRMFPISNKSQTIIDCFLNECRKLGIIIETGIVAKDIQKTVESFEITTTTQLINAQKVVVAAGSSAKVWDILQNLGHNIIAPIPSLFTFNVVEKEITALAGISKHVSVSIPQLKLKQAGNLLITHWGFSGPAVLRLSAVAARELAKLEYRFQIQIDWLNEESSASDYESELRTLLLEHHKKTIVNTNLFGFSNRHWLFLLEKTAIPQQKKIAELSKKDYRVLATVLRSDAYQINGKSTFKEEFVTAGGVSLKDINFKDFSSKKTESLYIVGECLDIDAVTGGFNFQNAWTGGFLAAMALTQ